MPRKLRLEYPWTSYGAYLASPEHRPGWVRVDRLLGKHGIPEDTLKGRQRFEAVMQRRRMEETDPEALMSLRRGWCLGKWVKPFHDPFHPECRRGGRCRLARGIGCPRKTTGFTYAFPNPFSASF